MKQKDEIIAVPKKWVTDVVDGTSSISNKDILVYMVMRCYAKGASSIEVANYAVGNNESIEWVCELRADIINPKVLRDVLYDVSKNYVTKYTDTIKQSIYTLVNNGMIVCYDEVKDKSYSGSEFIELCDKWNSDDIVYYFPVPADYYFVPANDVLKLIKYCKKKKELSVDYYIMLYLMVEFNFSISKIKGRCYMRSPRSTYFTSRKHLWDKASDILRESVGIYCVVSRYGVVGDSIGTQQNFFENEDEYLAFKGLTNSSSTSDGLACVDDSYFGIVEDPVEDPQKEVEDKNKSLNYRNHPFVLRYEENIEKLLAECCVRGVGFPPDKNLSLKQRQQREQMKKDWELYKLE